MLRIMWGAQNTGGIAVAFTVEPMKTELVFEQRITVQPNIYVGVASTSTGQANDVIFHVYYELVKLTNALEFAATT